MVKVNTLDNRFLAAMKYEQLGHHAYGLVRHLEVLYNYGGQNYSNHLLHKTPFLWLIYVAWVIMPSLNELLYPLITS